MEERTPTHERRSRRPRVRGWMQALFWLTLLLGLLSIAVPNVRDAMQRGKRKRAFGDIRTIARSVDARRQDLANVPLGFDGYIGEDLTNLLVPTYLDEMPTGEPWGVPYEYYSWEDEDGSRHYQVICRGADSRPSAGPGRYDGPVGIASRCANDDIVFQDGLPIVWPEGRQDLCP